MISHVWIVIKKYLGETSHSLKKQINERMRKLKKRNINNGLVGYNLETDPKLSFKDSKIWFYIHNKKQQKLVESRIISNQNQTETWLFSFIFLFNLISAKNVLKKITYFE